MRSKRFDAPERGNEGARRKGDHMYIGGGFIALILIILLLIWLF
jgi:flagellar biogenesis protein FliO